MSLTRKFSSVAGFVSVLFNGLNFASVEEYSDGAEPATAYFGHANLLVIHTNFVSSEQLCCNGPQQPV
jgi:hypothetical protein